jgi:thymidine kinase
MALHVVCGPMFSGKTTLAMQTVRRYRSVGTNVMILSHSSDTRYTLHGLGSHDAVVMTAHLGTTLMPFVDQPDWHESRVIVVEEAQFFPDLVEFCLKAVETCGKTVFVYGLDGNFRREPFGHILELAPLADTFHKIAAFCKLCQNDTPAIFTAAVQAMPTDGVCVAGADVYKAVCRKHFKELN